MKAVRQALLLAQWQLRRQSIWLPILVVVHVTMVVATVVDYGPLVGNPTPEIAPFAATRTDDHPDHRRPRHDAADGGTGQDRGQPGLDAHAAGAPIAVPDQRPARLDAPGAPRRGSWRRRWRPALPRPALGSAVDRRRRAAHLPHVRRRRLPSQACCRRCSPSSRRRCLSSWACCSPRSATPPTGCGARFGACVAGTPPSFLTVRI
jgi:hypothetical protein